MNLMRILNSRNFLLFIGFIYSYTFVLSPFLADVFRNKNYDYKNIIYKNESLHFSLSFGTVSKNPHNTDILIWERDIPYLKKNKVILENFTFTVPEELSKNKTSGYFKINVKSNDRKNRKRFLDVYSSKKAVNWFIPKRKNYRNLVRQEINKTEKVVAPSGPVPFVFRSLRYDLIYVEDHANPSSLSPLDVKPFKFFMDNTFCPPARFDTFFDINTERRRVNLTEGHNVTLQLEINIRGMHRYSVKNVISEVSNLYSSWGDFGSFMVTRINEFKRIFIETDPTLLWTTGIATILHFIFSVMAFEQDMQFWLRKSSFRGVSMRSIVNSLISDTIIFMYVLDNDTPTIMRFMDFLNICKHIWKISKLVDFKFSWPFIQVKEELKGDSDEADSQGMKYLYILLLPLLFIYFIYELFTQEFVSVKSYIIHCLAGAMYSFGFLGMLPQLFVNYKLKTVAGMSKSALAFKFLNTFIDDLYTFVSKMPLMAKIACFRDDVIFFIWVFQCCIYDTDPTRPNEYNLVSKAAIKEAEEKKAQKEHKEEEETEEEEKSDNNENAEGKLENE